MTAVEPGPNSPPQDRVAIGIVRKPHGLRGQVCVSGFGNTLAQCRVPVKLWLGRDAQSAREITVTEMSENPKGFICTINGYGDMDAAETLRDHLLFCGRASLPELDKGTHYSYELEGLLVVGEEDGKPIGIVTDVENYPTVDCLEVRQDNGSTISIAMTPGVIRSIDKAEGIITVSQNVL